MRQSAPRRRPPPSPPSERVLRVRALQLLAVLLAGFRAACSRTDAIRLRRLVLQPPVDQPAFRRPALDPVSVRALLPRPLVLVREDRLVQVDGLLLLAVVLARKGVARLLLSRPHEALASSLLAQGTTRPVSPSQRHALHVPPSVILMLGMLAGSSPLKIHAIPTSIA